MDTICKKCGGKFGFELVGTVYPGGKDREEACCPYCGEIAESRMTSQVYSVWKIEEGDSQNKAINLDRDGVSSK